MELRQLRYFVTLAEELHFGRAAAREHIVQSALSQQVQRLERELGVPLLERTTHHVRLTAAGSVFLLEARQILAHVDRAAAAAQQAARSAPALRVGTVDASYDSMPMIVRRVQARLPDLEIHQVEAGVPEQYRLLAGGRLDIGIGRASLAPPEVASELFRLDPLGVLVCESHRFASSPGVPVAELAEEPLLLAEEQRAPEFNQFVIELCRSVGFLPAVYRGTVESIRAAVDLVGQGRTVLCAPASCVPAHPGVVWRPLTEPVSAIHGRCSGGPRIIPSRSVPWCPAPASCHGSWAGWKHLARRSGEAACLLPSSAALIRRAEIGPFPRRGSAVC